MTPPHLRGLIAATVLPLTDAFEPDTPALRDYLTWLLEQGVHGLAVNVDTGEGPHLTHAERLHVLETACAVVNGRVPVISGLAPGATAAATSAARELKSAGADALLVFPGAAFRGSPLPAALPLDYHRAIGEGADIPLILFQLQESLGGVTFPAGVLLALARLEHVVALKEATFDAVAFRETVAALNGADAGIAILSGNDNFIQASFEMGADGALIGFGTLAVREQVTMVAAQEAGDVDRAREIGARVQRLADVIFAAPVRDYRVRLKEALVRLGVIPRAAIRPPLQPVSEAERQRIGAALDEAGLL